MEVSREQYLSALETIDLYHRLFFSKDLIKDNSELPKLKNVVNQRFLTAIHTADIDSDMSIDCFCKKFTVKEVSRFRYLGNKTISDMQELFREFGVEWI